jgi:hypothetical protein
MSAKDKGRQIINNASVTDFKGETDTIRLWESYRDQALLWRAMALLQIPATIAALLFAFTMWTNRSITLNVPAEPKPGIYSALHIPDAKLIEAAQDVVNLIATYTPGNVQVQFSKAREFLIEPLISKFDIEIMQQEMKAIVDTNRTQIFFVDPTKTTIERKGDAAFVVLSGERTKIVAGTDLGTTPIRYGITLTTVPRNVLNPYGIVVNNIQVETITKENKGK